MEKQNFEPGRAAPDRPATPGFQLPDDAPAQIRAFFRLWSSRWLGDLPQADAFDIAALSADYPLLVCVGVRSEDQSLFWRHVAATRGWPFKAPVANRPVALTSPIPTESRMLLAFKEALASGLPDYSRITSWMHGGETVSVARLVMPVAARPGRELLALWEVVQTGSD
jgi:hypothetical protein